MELVVAGVIIKTKDGRKYTYYEYYENSKTHQVYCGSADSKKAKIMALETEYKQFDKKYKFVTTKMKQIKKELGKLK